MRILATKQKGKDIYPPVDIKISILFFLKKIIDLIIEEKKLKKFKGNKNKLFVSFGVSIIVALYFSRFKNLAPRLSTVKKHQIYFLNVRKILWQE